LARDAQNSNPSVTRFAEKCIARITTISPDQEVHFEIVAANDSSLSVSSYVEVEDTRELVEIGTLNAELKTTVARIDQLRSEIDLIVAEIVG
jgi:type I restriction-modification system DNA methylase subunit